MRLCARSRCLRWCAKQEHRIPTVWRGLLGLFSLWIPSRTLWPRPLLQVRRQIEDGFTLVQLGPSSRWRTDVSLIAIRCKYFLYSVLRLLLTSSSHIFAHTFSDYMKKVEEGKIKPRACDLPSFLFESGTIYDANEPDKGLFRSHTVIRVRIYSSSICFSNMLIYLDTSLDLHGRIFYCEWSSCRFQAWASRASWNANCTDMYVY